MIGRQLRDMREQHNMTQKELGERLRVHSDMISKYELNKREPSDALKMEIAEMFDCSLDYLVGFDRHCYVDEVHIPYRELNKDDIEKIQDYVDMVVECSKGKNDEE